MATVKNAVIIFSEFACSPALIITPLKLFIAFHQCDVVGIFSFSNLILDLNQSENDLTFALAKYIR